jgi:hypothetical protein
MAAMVGSMSVQPTISFAGCTFLKSKGCIACAHVMRGWPVLLFRHDLDGDIQFACGAGGHGDEDWHWLHVTHVLAEHPDLMELPTIPIGFEAERGATDQRWAVQPL